MMSSPDPTGPDRPCNSRALADWVASFRRAPLWSALALEDLRDRYRRSTLGLLWIVLSFTLFVVVKVAIFGQLSSVAVGEFGLFVTIGFGLWTYISSIILDGCTTYVHARPWILGTSTPHPVFILQTIYRNWLVFTMILVVMAVALIIWRPLAWDLKMLWSVPGLIAYLFTSLWLVCIVAPLCARHRDLYHLVQTSMRLLFFATPILWLPEPETILAKIALWNPAAHFVSIVRDPLLYGTIPCDSWAIVLAINFVGAPAAWFTYTLTRRNVIFWI